MNRIATATLAALLSIGFAAPAHAAGACALLTGTYAIVQDASIGTDPALSLGKVTLTSGNGRSDAMFTRLASRQAEHSQTDITCAELPEAGKARLSFAHTGAIDPKGFAGSLTIQVYASGANAWTVADNWNNNVKGSGWMVRLPPRR
jgi:hypothetical protein